MATLQEQVAALAQQVTQKDEMINILKIKTRDFVQNLKDEHATALRGLEEQLAKERANKDTEGAQRLDELRAELNASSLEVQKYQAAATEKDQRIESLTFALTEHKRFHAKELEETQLKHEQLVAEQEARIASLITEVATLHQSNKSTVESASLPVVQADVSEFLRKIESLETENRHLASDCAAQRCLADELNQQLAAATATQAQPQTSPGADSKHNHEQQIDAFASQLAQKYQEVADLTNQLDAQKVQAEENHRALAGAERQLSTQTLAHEAATEELQQQVLGYQSDLQKLASEVNAKDSDVSSLQARLLAVQQDAEAGASTLRERLAEHEGLVSQLQAQLQTQVASSADAAQAGEEALSSVRTELKAAKGKISELEAQCQEANEAAAQANRKRVAQTAAAEQGLASEVTAVQAELTQERLRCAQLQASLENSEAQISDLTTQLSTTSASEEAAQEQLQRVTTEASQLRERLAEHDGLVAQLQTQLQTHLASSADADQVKEEALSTLRREVDAANDRILELEAQCQAVNEAAAHANRDRENAIQADGTEQGLVAVVQAELSQERLLCAQLKASLEKYEAQIADLSTQLLATAASGEAAQEQLQQSQAERATLKASVQKYEAQISDLTTLLSSTTTSGEEVQQQLQQSQAEVAALQASVERYVGHISDLTTQLSSTKASGEAAQEQLQRVTAEASQLLERLVENEGLVAQLQTQQQAQLVASNDADQANEEALSSLRTELDAATGRISDLEAQCQAADEAAAQADRERAAQAAAAEQGLVSEVVAAQAELTQERILCAQLKASLEQAQLDVDRLTETEGQLRSALQGAEVAKGESLAELESTLREEIHSLKAQRTQEQGELAQSQAELATMKASQEKYEAQISDLTAQLSTTSASGKAAQEQHQQIISEASLLREKLAEVEKRAAQQQVQLEAKQAAVSQLTAQITSQQADLDSVLSQLTEKVDLLDAANKTAKSLEEKLEVLKKNHTAWKEEALRHTKDLDLQVEQLSAQRTAIAAERDAAVLLATNEKHEQEVQLAQLTAHLQTLEEEGVRRSGEGRGEIIVLKNEIEARTQQIGVLSAEKADWLLKQQHVENERLSLASQRDDLQLHLEDVMQSLTSKDETISKMSRSSEDRERTLRTQLSELQSKSKQRVGDLVGQVEQLQAEVAKRMLEVEGLTESLSQLTRSSDENKASLVAAKAQLETERSQNQERKLKVRAYLDNLSKENKALQEAHATMQATAKDAVAAKNYMEQHRNQLESALHSAKEQAAKELDARSKEWIQVENGYHSQLGEKDAEIRHLLLQVDLASQSNVEEVTATRQLIQESMREMEAHKAKRLAARSEMINLAKTLERAQSDGDEVKAQLQFVLSPIVTEQIARLEGLVRDIEKVSFHLTSGKETTALTASTNSRGGHSSLALRQETANPLNARNAPGTPDKGSKTSRNLIEFTPQGFPKVPSQDVDGLSGHGVEEVVPRSKHDFNSITDALVQVEALRQELERVQMGLALMTFSVEKLMDIVTAEPVCCAGFFDFLVPRTQQAIGRDSTGPYTTSQASVGQYSNGATSRQSAAGGPTNTNGSRLGRVSNIVAAGASAIPFQNRKIQQAGYKNINTNPNAFSIECTDDDDEM